MAKAKVKLSLRKNILKVQACSLQLAPQHTEWKWYDMPAGVFWE